MMTMTMKDAIIGCLMLAFVYLTHAERDFNFNDMQIPLLEPKDNQPSIVSHTSENPYVAEVSRCTYLENEIILSLVLKHYDWRDMSDVERTKVLDKLSQFFAIPKEFITLETVSKRDLNQMYELSIRKGNHKCKSNNRRWGRVNLMIGCGGSYFTMGTPIANQIGHQMKDGSIDNITGQKFGCWTIWTKQSKKSRTERNRRQVEGSGENYEYDDDYDYEEETTRDVETEMAVSSNNNVSTTVSTTLATSSTNSKESTTVVPTPTHAHRHHHGDQQPDLSSNEIHSSNNFEEIRKKNNQNVKVQETEEIVSTTATTTMPISRTTKTPLPTTTTSITIQEAINSNRNTIDETIVESVSQLESVITKTIENTENIDNEPSLVSMVESDKENLVIGIDVPMVDSVMEINNNITSTTMPTITTTTPTDINSISKDKNKAMEIPIKRFNLEQLPTDGKQLNEELTTINVPFVENNENTLTTASSVEITSVASTMTNSLLTSQVMPDKTASSSSTTSAPSGTATSADILTQVYLTSTSINFISSSSIDWSKDEETTTPTNDQQVIFSTTVGQTKLAMTSSTVSSSTAATTVNATTPTPSITDYVELVAENSAPMIKIRLQKLAVTSGKLFTYIVPVETFYDAEDKTNLRLQLTNKDGQEISSNSWLQFNTETHEIIGLPLDDAVSRWQYRLTATDSGNASVTEIVEMTVQQHRGVRSVNHEIDIVVQLQEGSLRQIDWQIKLMRAIASILGENGTDAIVVREVRQTPSADANTATFVYFNETLPSSKCPEMELGALTKALDVQELQQLVTPGLNIKQVTGQLIGACQKQLPPPLRPKPTSTVVKNAPPQPRNQVDRVNATSGHLLVYKVPSDTFYDDHELTLTLRTKENRELSPRHWLQFDSKNQEFYGIPKSVDIGTEEYLLVAENSLGLSANDALVVVVSHSAKRDYIAYFKAYLGIRHEQFNADLQRKFVERIASLFGDAGTNYIQIRSVTTQHDADSTIVNFYNTTLHKTHNRCPEAQVDAARSIYLMPDNTPRERVKQLLGPELNLTNLQVHHLGSCHGQTDLGQREYPTAKSEIPTQSAFGENYMITIVYPAVIIVCMVLIATLIACCVHKRRRKSGKMELGDEEERKSFRTKGIPVIFQDELDEKPEIGNKSPIILKDEKPPLLPPSYNTSHMNGDNDVDEYVPPPAVVVGGREVRGKSPATPSYRKPPPYVSP